MENEFLNSMYYLLPTLSRLMGAAERDARPESYDDKRVETLVELLKQVISKFAQTNEGTGLPTSRRLAPFSWSRGLLRTPRFSITKQPGRNGEKLHERILGDVLANFAGTGKPN